MAQDGQKPSSTIDGKYFSERQVAVHEGHVREQQSVAMGANRGHAGAGVQVPSAVLSSLTTPETNVMLQK